MKNICMITQSPYPFDPRVRRQAEKLAHAGFYVDILCIPTGSEPAEQSFGDKITAYRVIRKNKGQESIRKYLWLSFRFFVSAFFKLQKLNKVKRYSLIQIHNMPESHIFIASLQKMKGVPLVLDVHDLTPELLTSKWENRLTRIFKPVAVFLEKRSCRFASHVITVTEGCREILAKRSVPAEKISLVLNTANTNIFPYDRNRVFKKIDKNARLLYHGTVAERFGLHVIVDAMPLILKKIPGTILQVYGKYDADYKKFLIDKINRKNLKDNILLGGARLHEQLYEIMKESDLEVVPYLSNEYMNLSLSTKTFECAAAGLPIIATRLRTLSLTFDDNAIRYANDQNPADFAEKIVHLLYNPDEREQLAINAYNALNGISGDIMEERYLEIIEKVSGLTREADDRHPAKQLSRKASIL